MYDLIYFDNTGRRIYDGLGASSIHLIRVT